VLPPWYLINNMASDLYPYVLFPFITTLHIEFS
jgi:hypothetical protein